MAPCANRKVVTAKGSLPVVTRHATKRARRSVMIKRLRCADLSSRYAGADLVTFTASQSFVLVVLRMTETDAERLGHLPGTHVTT